MSRLSGGQGQNYRGTSEYGKEMGYAPLKTWISQDLCLLSENCDSTLITTAHKTTVLTASADLIKHVFSREVKQDLLQSAGSQLEFLKERTEQIYRGLSSENGRLIEATQRLKKTKRNF